MYCAYICFVGIDLYCLFYQYLLYVLAQNGMCTFEVLVHRAEVHCSIQIHTHDQYVQYTVLLCFYTPKCIMPIPKCIPCCYIWIHTTKHAIINTTNSHTYCKPNVYQVARIHRKTDFLLVSRLWQ